MQLNIGMYMFMHKLEHLQIESQRQGHKTSLQEYIINLDGFVFWGHPV